MQATGSGTAENLHTTDWIHPGGREQDDPPDPALTHPLRLFVSIGFGFSGAYMIAMSLLGMSNVVLHGALAGILFAFLMTFSQEDRKVHFPAHFGRGVIVRAFSAKGYDVEYRYGRLWMFKPRGLSLAPRVKMVERRDTFVIVGPRHLLHRVGRELDRQPSAPSESLIDDDSP